MLQRKIARRVLLALTAGYASATFALVEGTVDANVKTSPWGAVVSITRTSGTFSGVLLDPYHILTARTWSMAIAIRRATSSSI